MKTRRLIAVGEVKFTSIGVGISVFDRVYFSAYLPKLSNKENFSFFINKNNKLIKNSDIVVKDATILNDIKLEGRNILFVSMRNEHHKNIKRICLYQAGTLVNCTKNKRSISPPFINGDGVFYMELVNSDRVAIHKYDAGEAGE